MAKVENARTIIANKLANNTGNLVYVSLHMTGQSFQISVKILKESSEGKSISQTMIAYRNAAMARGVGNIYSYLERMCRYKDLHGRFALDEAHVPEFVDRLNRVNDEVNAEAQQFLDTYDERRAETEDLIMDLCIKNKRKRNAKNIISNAMRGYPSKNQVMSGHIYYTMDTDGTEAYEELSPETKSLVDASRIYEAEYNRCQHLASRCSPVFECLLKFLKQVMEKGKLNGCTVTSYLNATDELKVANETEFSAPLPDITDFLNNSGKVLDEPAKYIDYMIWGFIRFYVTQGMIDYIPFEAATPVGYCREIVEEIGENPKNSFSLLLEDSLAEN